MSPHEIAAAIYDMNSKSEEGKEILGRFDTEDEMQKSLDESLKEIEIHLFELFLCEKDEGIKRINYLLGKAIQKHQRNEILGTYLGLKVGNEISRTKRQYIEKLMKKISELTPQQSETDPERATIAPPEINQTEQEPENIAIAPEVMNQFVEDHAKFDAKHKNREELKSILHEVENILSDLKRKKQFAAMALAIYGEGIIKKGKFTPWMNDFCVLFNKEKSTYKPNDLREDAHSLKVQYSFLKK